MEQATQQAYAAPTQPTHAAQTADGPVQVNGSIAPAIGAAVSNAAASAATTSTEKDKTGRNRNGGGRRGGGRATTKAATAAAGMTTAAANPDQSSITILLPKPDYDWFSQQAREAEYEPSLAKYLQWQLRRLAKEQRTEAECAAKAAMEAAKNQMTWYGQPLTTVNEETEPDEALTRAIYNDGKAGQQ